MGLAIRLTGVSFSRYIDRAVPYLAEALGYYEFGADFDSSKINRVPGATTNLTATGTPTYGEGYVPLAATTEYFNTGINVTGSQTLLMIATKPTNTERLFAPSSGAGLTLRGGGATSLRLDCTVSGGNVPTLTLPQNVNYMLFGASIAGTTGSYNKMYTSAAGAVVETSVTTGNGLVANLGASTGGILVGPSAAPSGGSGYRLAAFMLFDTQRALAEIEEIFDYWKFALPKRGAIVVA